VTKKARIDNLDIIPFALYELGGAGQFIDVEDIFLRCFEVAPERFRWRKHSIANYKTLSKALRDFEGRHPDLLLKTEDGLSRQLSKEGIDWVKERLDLFQGVLSQPGTNPPTRRREQKLLNEFSAHRLVRAFQKGDLKTELPKYEVADLLLCAPDSPTTVWKERLETYRSAATVAGRPNLVAFLDFIRNKRPEWFGGENG
jgi:hypothetical protein